MNNEPPKQKRRFEGLRSSKHVQRRLKKIESATLRHAHKFIFQRWKNVQEVRRHALAWLMLVGVLIGSLVLQSAAIQRSYQVVTAAESGTYAEGVLGQLDSLNPIFATTHPERSASKLLFSGLLSYDASGALKTDLAESWQVSEDGRQYTVVLKDDLKWQDGAPITSKDVAFTIGSIKEADTRSPLYASWRDIPVAVVDDRTVRFTLPNPYAPFPHFLTVGILPAHKFINVAAADLRGAQFNRQPVGSGPFSFKNLQVISADRGRLVVHMVANPTYFGGKPKLERFQLHVYGEREELQKAFLSDEVNAVADFTAQDIKQIGDMQRYKVMDVPLNNAAMAIFKTNDGPLSDKAVRQALRLSTDRDAIISGALGGRATPLDTPIPPSLLGAAATQKQPGFDIAAAEKTLNDAGWVRGQDGKRAKGGQPLRIAIASVKTGDYPKVVEKLTENWNKIGITVQTVLVNPEEVQQDIIAPRSYDVLLYELAIGGDPDVFAYWHSSQANSRGLNLANYNSGKADDALDSARSRFEMDLRAAKYKTFVDQWLEDVPGVVLYQPNLHYVTKTTVSALEGGSLVDAVDRYRNVQYWSVSQDVENQTP